MKNIQQKSALIFILCAVFIGLVSAASDTTKQDVAPRDLRLLYKPNEGEFGCDFAYTQLTNTYALQVPWKTLVERPRGLNPGLHWRRMGEDMSTCLLGWIVAAGHLDETEINEELFVYAAVSVISPLVSDDSGECIFSKTDLSPMGPELLDLGKVAQYQDAIACFLSPSVSMYTSEQRDLFRRGDVKLTDCENSLVSKANGLPSDDVADKTTSLVGQGPVVRGMRDADRLIIKFKELAEKTPSDLLGILFSPKHVSMLASFADDSSERGFAAVAALALIADRAPADSVAKWFSKEVVSQLGAASVGTNAVVWENAVTALYLLAKRAPADSVESWFSKEVVSQLGNAVVDSERRGLNATCALVYLVRHCHIASLTEWFSRNVVFQLGDAALDSEKRGLNATYVLANLTERASADSVAGWFSKEVVSQLGKAALGSEKRGLNATYALADLAERAPTDSVAGWFSEEVVSQLGKAALDPEERGYNATYALAHLGQRCQNFYLAGLFSREVVTQLAAVAVNAELMGSAYAANALCWLAQRLLYDEMKAYFTLDVVTQLIEGMSATSKEARESIGVAIAEIQSRRPHVSYDQVKARVCRRGQRAPGRRH